ncbi:MAG: hypothetical protein IJ683_04590 [Butyrivibrio sp.]|nr:hypothetical protein [Butyrivibrio sp.]MBR1641584.1 hypothetical protein [Butyrivibrio sp.]
MGNNMTVSSGYYSSFVNFTQRKSAVSQTGSLSFTDSIKAAGRSKAREQKVDVSAVDDYARRHPDAKAQLDRFVNAGEKVLSQYGSGNVEEMSMDEYKEYIYGVLDRIPFDSSQMRDTQFIDITEDGWKQMKNDPKYEAWVVGYFKIDRSFHNPFAGFPGVEPSIHTEHFGASIDEHLGQSYPKSTATGKEKDSEDWWKKRKERQEQYLEESEELAEKRKIAREHGVHKAPPIITADGITNVNRGPVGNEMYDISAAAEFFAMIASGGGESARK